jgi:hypothetical protein
MVTPFLFRRSCTTHPLPPRPTSFRLNSAISWTPASGKTRTAGRLQSRWVLRWPLLCRRGIALTLFQPLHPTSFYWKTEGGIVFDNNLCSGLLLRETELQTSWSSKARVQEGLSSFRIPRQVTGVFQNAGQSCFLISLGSPSVKLSVERQALNIKRPWALVDRCKRNFGPVL